MATGQGKETSAGLSRKMGRRDFLRLTGLTGTTALLSACAGAPLPQAAPGAGTEKAGAPAVIKPKRKVLRLQSSYPVDYPNTLVMAEDVFAEFKDTHPDFDVEVNFVRVPDVAVSFVQALEVDQAPDFFYCFETQGTLAYLGHLYDLTDVVKEVGLWDDFYQPAKDLWTFEGKLIGIPTYYGVKCYVYRADIWEEAGLDPDNFPTTWEDFQEAAIRLTERDAAGNIVRDGYRHQQDWEHLVSHIHQNGGSEYASDDALAPSAINSPEALEAFAWWCDLVRKYEVQAREGQATPEGANPILDGYAGIDLQGPWWVPESRPLRPEMFDQGLIRVGLPLKRKAQVGHLDASGWGVNAHSDILEEVLDFVKIFLKDAHYMHYHDAVSPDSETIYRMPTSRRSINEHPDFWISQEPVVRDTAYLKAFDVGQSTARLHVGFGEVRTYIYPRMVEQAIYEIKPDQVILDAAAKEMDKITERTRKELA